MSVVSTACLDWQQRLIDGRSLVPSIDLDSKEAERANRWFGRLQLPDVIGTPFLRDVVGDWYRDAVIALFGSYDVQTHKRRIATVHMVLPKKQGKTTLSGGTMVTALLMNKRPNARFGILGGTQKIAEEAYDAAAGMIELNPKLKSLLKTTDHTKTIEHRLNGGYLNITTFDLKVATGGKFAGCLIDELHLLGSMSKADRVIGQIRGARVALQESFIWFITTQSEERPAGVFKTELEYARSVRDGEIFDPSYLPIIYEFPKEIQADEGRAWQNPELWRRVMPSLGISVDQSILEDQFREAQHKGEAEVRRWASQHLNIEIGTALSGDGWPGAEDWESCADTTLTLEELLKRSEVITIGVDLGGKDDLFSLCVVGREPGAEIMSRRRWLAWGHSWCHKIAVERRKSEASKYADFEKAGELTIVERLGDDVDQAVEIIKTVYDSGLLAGIGLDPNRVGPLLGALEEAQIRDPSAEHDIVVAVTQGRALQGAVISTERKLDARSLTHAGQMIMGWAASNAKCEVIGNTMLVTKKASGNAKIDPIMALFDAIYLMDRDPEPRTRRSIYDAGEIWESSEEGSETMKTPAIPQFARPSIFDQEWN